MVATYYGNRLWSHDSIGLLSLGPPWVTPPQRHNRDPITLDAWLLLERTAPICSLGLRTRSFRACPGTSLDIS